MKRTFGRTLTVATMAVLLASAPVVAQQQEQSDRFSGASISAGLNDGTLRAESVGTGGYMAGGLVSGLVLGLIGTAVVYAVAASSDVSLPATQQALISSQPAEYIQGYRTGYAEKVKGKRKGSALAGGLLGTGILVLLVVSAGG